MPDTDSIIVISKPSGAATGTWYLKAERVTHSFDRAPSQSPFPASATGVAGIIFGLDLGQCKETIQIEGLVDSTGTTANPSKNNLETVLRTWWEYGDDGAIFPIVSLSSGTANSYRGSFSHGSFTQMGALEDRWQYNITFLVREKVT